jgi:hypothetical protein
MSGSASANTLTAMSIDISKQIVSNRGSDKSAKRTAFRIEGTPVAMGMIHLCLVAADSMGREIALRGGPTNGGVLSPSATKAPSDDNFGPIVMTVGLYEPGFIDHALDAVWNEVNLNGQDPAKVLASFIAVAKAIDDRRIPYYPTSPNSNSAVGTMLRRSGCTATPPGVAPGFETDLLPVSKL